MKFRKTFAYFIISVCLLTVLAFFCRNIILDYSISRLSEKLQHQYNLKLVVDQSAFKGLNKVLINHLTVTPANGDTLLKIDSLLVTPSFYKLLFGKLSYRRLQLSEVSIFLHSDSLGSNYRTNTDEKKSSSAIDKPASAGYGSRINSLFNRMFELITGETLVRNFRIEFSSPGNYRKYHLPEFKSDGQTYSTLVYNVSQKDTIIWEAAGEIRKKDRGLTFKMVRTSASTNMVSLTGSKNSFKWLLDTLYFEVKGTRTGNNEMLLVFKGDFYNLQMNHWRISPEDVNVSYGEMDLNVRIGPNYIRTDSTSTITLNKFTSKVVAGFQKEGPTYELQVSTGKIPAPDLFESLPFGMFNTLQGIKTKGEVSYRLNFKIDKQAPDSLIFDSELKKFNFGISKFGNDYLPRINEEFTYTAYDGDRPLRSFSVGPSNPFFTPYNQISNFLKCAVMTAEDGSFLIHGGFNEEAFRQSIATNIRQGRFARGGSTISMQLVKNVYLSRNKTIARKLEEILIVWLIEKNRLVSKERMFEVYLNIIEWGPNVYGIREASEFYFSKLPSQLTLAESIFLASIIPHPKYFKYSFDEAGNLKPYLSGFYRIVTDRMLRKEWITPADTTNLSPFVQLNGPALQFIIPSVAYPVDSTADDDPDFMN